MNVLVVIVKTNGKENCTFLRIEVPDGLCSFDRSWYLPLSCYKLNNMTKICKKEKISSIDQEDVHLSRIT